MKKLLLRLAALVAVTVVAFMSLPQSSASAGICNPGEIYCMPNVEQQISGLDNCNGQGVMNGFGVFTGSCTSADGLDDAPFGALPTKQSIPIPFVSAAMVKMTQMAQADAELMLTYVLVDQLSGKNTSTNPVLICSESQFEVRQACAGKPEWFLGQYKIMRDIAIYVTIPLFFMMVISSLIKGSLYNLLRNSLMMFPLAIIGTAVIIVFMQMLLNITDDFCNYILGRATTGLETDSCMDSLGHNVTSTACGLKNSLADRSVGSSGLFVALVWFWILLGAGVALYMELVGRQIGIYMMALMLPLVMAGLVWPRTVGIAKKVFQYEIALIVSKVFIVAALSLGMGAYAHTGSTTCRNGTADGSANTCTNAETDNQGSQSTAATNGGFQAVASGTLIILLAAVSGAKVVTLSPAAMAGTAPVWNKGALASRGQVIAVIGQRIGQFQDWRAKNRKPGDNFTNGAPTGGGGAGAGAGAGSGGGGSGGDGKTVTAANGGTYDPTTGKATGRAAVGPPSPDGKHRKDDPPGADSSGKDKDDTDKKDAGAGAGKGGREMTDFQKKCERFANTMDKFADRLENLDTGAAGQVLGLGGKFAENWRKASKEEEARKKRFHMSKFLPNGGDSMIPGTSAVPGLTDSGMDERLQNAHSSVASPPPRY